MNVTYKIIETSSLFDVLKVNKNNKIVLTNGCFDLFHYGHASALDSIKERVGDDALLIVAVNSDKSVKRIKGDSRPIYNQEQRAYLVACHQAVDVVFIFDDDNIATYIKMISPDFWFKSEDYNLNSLNVLEKLAIAECGGQVLFTPLVNDVSTSIFIEKIKNV